MANGHCERHSIANRTELWWDPKRPEAAHAMWKSKFELGEEFF